MIFFDENGQLLQVNKDLCKRERESRKKRHVFFILNYRMQKCQPGTAVRKPNSNRKRLW